MTSSRLLLPLLAAASGVLGLAALPSGPDAAAAPLDPRGPNPTAAVTADPVVHECTVEVAGLELFYREAGSPDAPTVLLLHGFPTSSRMFRNLIPALADRYHVVAPDYPGFGRTETPPVDAFDYSFDHLAAVVGEFVETIGLERYSLYVMDYGAPIGFRLATAHPERVDALVVQNGNAYVEGLSGFWDPLRKYWADPSAVTAEPLLPFLTLEGTKWQYQHGTRDPSALDASTWTSDQELLDRPGNRAIQLQLFLSYGTNPPLYPSWQQYLREHQPPTLVVWGKNDEIFPASGARPYARDLDHVELHLLDTGHFALEEECDRIARLMRRFFDENVSRATAPRRN